MNILAIETSTKRLCLGLSNQKGRIAEYNLDSEKRHTELLLPTIKKALRRLRLSLAEIDYFAVGLGPGSFTGLRIGLATIKGFSAALSKPVIGLPTLDLLADNALSAGGKIICPVIDAKRNLVFTALYEVGVKDKLRRKSPYLLISIEELLKKIRSLKKSVCGRRIPSQRVYAHKTVIFLGDGLKLYQDKIRQKIGQAIFLNQDAWYPQPKSLIKLAVDLIDRGRLNDAARIKPIYLYPKECQIRNKN
jgi:tRNA threonylcarbamoyladenosine biosynthesis protein TsaB